MNGKKARQLRKMTTKQYVPNQVWEAYAEENVHTKTYFNPEAIQPVKIQVSTVVLDSCQKLFYREMKRLYKLRKQGREATLTF